MSKIELHQSTWCFQWHVILDTIKHKQKNVTKKHKTAYIDQAYYQKLKTRLQKKNIPNSKRNSKRKVLSQMAKSKAQTSQTNGKQQSYSSFGKDKSWDISACIYFFFENVFFLYAHCVAEVLYKKIKLYK